MNYVCDNCGKSTLVPREHMREGKFFCEPRKEFRATIGDEEPCAVWERRIKESMTLANRDGANRATRWLITDKGRLIAQAIMCDADNLRRLKLRKGHESQGLINDDSHRRWVERQERKKKQKAK